MGPNAKFTNQIGRGACTVQSQTGADRRVAEKLLFPSITSWWRQSNPLGIRPNRQRTVSLQVVIVSRPVRGLLLSWEPAAHALQLKVRIRNINPRKNLCNKAAVQSNSGEKFIRQGDVTESLSASNVLSISSKGAIVGSSTTTCDW